MIDSLLIANRGEIACRIIRTCQRLGIRSIAVYSDADAGSLHVRQADSAVCIGPATAVHSYLNTEAIIQAALETGARAIHPGYGFLSEKPELPELCHQHHILWAGPRAEVIRRMGSKIEAKRIAEQANVAYVPGYHGDNSDPEALHAEAVRIGFPVLIKASAGGGGKGMRRVDRPEDFLAQLELAKEEARRAFGDDSILIEKLIARPRHLEVQLLGDQHGNLIHLFERECSIQRNYQKMIEEAPAAWLSTQTRNTLLESALRIGRAIQYDSVGTVEFVLDEDTGTPYFLEMNTRLQVEHTVTELVTGVDLVELQLHSASGGILPLSQEDIKITGCAIEARINSEDPAQGYQPQTGTLLAYHEPSLPGVRIDSGVAAGSTISPYYDSMIAKIMGHGLTRQLAAQRLAQGLEQFSMTGIGTNQALLQDILENPGFTQEPLTTLFMAKHYPDGWKIPSKMEKLAIAAGTWLALFPNGKAPGQQSLPWQAADGFRPLAAAGKRGDVVVHAGSHREPAQNVRVSRHGDTTHFTFEDGSCFALNITLVRDNELEVRGLETQPFFLSIAGTRQMRVIAWRGVTWNITTSSSLEIMAGSANADSAARGILSSPMPGIITEINVRVGQTVAARDVLLVMEAMKLIHPLETEIDGIVKAIHCEKGHTVGMGVPLVEIEAI